MTENYKKQLAAGKEYEKFIKEKLLEKRGIRLDIIDDVEGQYNIGETKQGYEIKLDKKYKETGNLYIEYKEKSNAKNTTFVPSGIFRQDNTHTWIIGDYNNAFMFKKDELVDIYNKKIAYRYVQINTSKGILLDKKLIEKYSIDHIKFE